MATLPRMLPRLHRIVETVRATLDSHDRFVTALAGAHRSAASAWSGLPTPTAEQTEANDYTLGMADWQGITLRIENPAHSIREGVGEDGKSWRNVMAAHYGEFPGTRGADGDPVDVFLGPAPESRACWMLNQRTAGGDFDEVKVLVGFHDERAAVDAYRLSYMPGWDRFDPPIRLSLAQLKWWLKYADTTRKFTPDQVPPEQEMPTDNTATPTLNRVFWDSAAMPTSGLSLADVLYKIRANDAREGLVMDAMTMRDIREGAEVLALDALVVQVGRLDPTVKAMMRMMEAAGGEVKPVAVQISEPLRRYGGVHVAALFELSDGQTMTVWFHNPDSTPTKLTPADDLVSWKWQLNKKDITIVVAPEKGEDLNIREVARRVMRLAEKNSAAFAKANVNRAARMSEIEGLRTTLAEKQGVLAGLQGQIEAVKAEAEVSANYKTVAAEGYEVGYAAGLAGESFLPDDSAALNGLIAKYVKLGLDVKSWLREGFNDGFDAGRKVFDANAAAEAESQARKQKLAERASLIVATWKAGDTEGAWNLQQEQDQLLGLPGSTKREAFFQNMTAMYPVAKPEPAPAEGNAYGLSDAEMVMLLATAGYKPFARMQNAMNETGISADDYNAARASLETKGFKVNSRMALLLKRGAITPEGAQVVKEFRPDIPFTDGKLRQFAGKFAAAAPSLDDFATWEDALIRLVEERMEADRSDAQGIVEAQELIRGVGTLRRLFETNYTPEAAYVSLFPEEAKPEPDPEPTPAPTKTAANLGLDDASPEAVELLAGNDKALSAAKEIEAAVKAAGGAVSFVGTDREPDALVFDGLFELDGARFVRGDITYKSRAMGSVTVNGEGLAFFTKADGSAFSGMPEEDTEAEDRRYAASEGLLGWTSKAAEMVGYMLDQVERDIIDEEEASKVNKAENGADDDEQDGADWPNTILDKSNPHWKVTLNDAENMGATGKTKRIGILRKGSQELIASAVYRGKNAAAWYIVLAKPGSKVGKENIPFPSISGIHKMGKVAAILMGYLDADEPSGFKIAPPGAAAEADDRNPLRVKAQAVRSELVKMGYKVNPSGESMTLERDGAMHTIRWVFEGPEDAPTGFAFNVTKLVNGSMVDEIEGLDGLAGSTPEVAAIKVDNYIRGMSAGPEPEATETAEAKFLREVGAGVHDALDLGEMLSKIEASVAAMQAAGQLAGDNDPVADAAILRWASLEEKANG